MLSSVHFLPVDLKKWADGMYHQQDYLHVKPDWFWKMTVRAMYLHERLHEHVSIESEYTLIDCNSCTQRWAWNNQNRNMSLVNQLPVK
jgi:hypothetical protein